MRIVIDMQGAQTESRFRGIGRYTTSFVEAVLRNRGDHEIILVLSSLLADTIDLIRMDLEGLVPLENFVVWDAVGPVNERNSGNSVRREIAELMREAFIASLAPDVVHVTSLFEGFVDDAVTSIGAFGVTIPTSVMLYDLIPLQNPESYLDADTRYATYYRKKIEHLKNASAYLAISEYSRKEGIESLGGQKEKFINIYSAVDEFFSPTEFAEEVLLHLRKKFGISHPFVLCVGGADKRKNLPRLIEAYAALEPNLREKHQLVLTGKMQSGDVEFLKKIGLDCGLRDRELCFTGFVNDTDLLQLYCLCKIYVFPSWHEGFGLPALEAMACGAAVLGANTSSLPEVIGWDSAMFDPFNTSDITEKLKHVLVDETFRTSLRENGLFQAKKFSWDKTASFAIKKWEQIGLAKEKNKKTWGSEVARLSEIYERLIKMASKIINDSKGIGKNEVKCVALSIYRNEKESKKLLRSGIIPKNAIWRIEGPFDSSYSLALVNREIARAMDGLGLNVVMHSTEGPGDFTPCELYLRSNPDLQNMYLRGKQIDHIDCDVVSRNMFPPRVSDMVARLNLLHAYGWEETSFPAEWVDAFNENLQGITVMSEHVRKVLIDNGVNVPIEVCKLGVDHWSRIKLDTSYELKAKKFRFLHVSSCFPRKGADVLLRAFGRAFRNQDDVSLIIKTFANPHNQIRQMLDEVRANDPDYPDVIILEDDWTSERLKALYSQCHALVAPSRAEGFGLPMAEAMQSGLAVITTNWSGQTEFCNEQTAWLIDYSFERANTHLGVTDSIWAEPNEDHLLNLMREVYETPEKIRMHRIEKGQLLIQKDYTWKNVAKKIISSANAFGCNSKLPKLTLGWVSTWNTKCGIATYSEHLLNCMNNSAIVLASNSDFKSAQDNKNIERCWVAGEEDKLFGIESAIESHRINVIMIQFNYGFFNLDYLNIFIERQIDAGRVVMVTLHSTVDPENAIHKKLSILSRSLDRCHRVLVHSHNDMNRLKRIGVVNNVVLFPHGVINYENYENYACIGKTIKLKTYGFFLPNKGLYQLVDAVAILKEYGMDVKLEMVNAEYPAKISTVEIKRVRDRIIERNLSEDVSICTDFLTDEVSLTRLSDADLVIFPYQKTGESASGAVRYGIASGRPVAVTPLSIFDDLISVVHRLPGSDARDIADGIVELVNNIRKKDSNFLEIENNAVLWRDMHSYWKVADRLSNIINSLHRDYYMLYNKNMRRDSNV